MATSIGKIFEKDLEKVFKQLKESHLLGWHRFTDSASAGGAFVQQQPSDYLVCLPPNPAVLSRMWYLEAKASEKHSRLQKAMLKPSQRGAIRFYEEMLRLTYYVVFWDVQGQRIEFWTGSEALSSSRKKKPFMVWDDISAHTTLNVDRVADLFVDTFRLPEKKLTLARYKETT